jgi:hypothetical protein
MSVRMEPSFGAIRRLYTPIHGHLVTSLDHLQDNGVYIAAPKAAFKPFQYTQIEEKYGGVTLPGMHQVSKHGLSLF